MPLDPQARAMLDEQPAADVPFDAIPVDLLREGLNDLFASTSGEPVAEIRDLAARGAEAEIPVRLYRSKQEGPLPGLVYFHGGGWVTGSLDSHDPLCRTLANRAGCAVVAVDYRLAPEHPFPAAPEDCFAALCWVAENAGSLGVFASRLAVAGDSAGGNLAAVTALLARERGGPELRHQILFYPAIARDFATGSYRDNAEGYFLTRAGMEFFWKSYLGSDPDDDPRANPSRAKDLSGLAPASVVTAGFDPLRDEGEAYAAQLIGAGVPTELRRWDGQIHGFVSFPDRLDGGRQALDYAAERLRAAFAV